MRGRTLAAALGGAVASLAFWLADLISLTTLSFAGVTDAEAQATVVRSASSSLALFELRLLMIHVGLGLALGWASLAFGTRGAHADRNWAIAGRGAALVVVYQCLASAAMMARYPQLYADLWWRAGGFRAWVLQTITHSIGPAPFEIGLFALSGTVAALSLRALWRRVGAASPRQRRLAASVVLLALISIVAATAFRARSRVPESIGAPNVLVLGIDSLRSDRIDSTDTMPFVASLAARGALYRSAFTPYAHTFPSWVSTLTGTEPRHHGVRSMFPRQEALGGIGPTLFSALRDRGYRTFVSSEFAGDVFSHFDGGFESVDTPTLTVDTLARSTALARHTALLPLLRLSAGRRLIPEWRNMPHLADPEWLVDTALDHIGRADDRPFAGLVFFGAAHFPYVGPYPYYRRGSSTYRGRFLYDVPPTTNEPLSAEDVTQARARYDGALSSIDRAFERLMADPRLVNTLVVITGDHGEELYEQEGLGGHGDVLAEHAQQVPILLLGPGVPRGVLSSSQVRSYDLPATVLSLVDPGHPQTFGDGASLFADVGPRPVCVETAVWFWPDLPATLRGNRLEYEPISRLLEVEPLSRAFVLRADRIGATEDAKDRGVILGNRLWHQRATPRGLYSELLRLSGPAPGYEDVDLPSLFQKRCIAGDPELAQVLDAVVYVPRAERTAKTGKSECVSCGLGR